MGDIVYNHMCIINFEKYSLKRLHAKRIYERNNVRYFYINRNSFYVDIARKFPANNPVQNLSESIFAAYGAQIADLPLTGT